MKQLCLVIILITSMFFSGCSSYTKEDRVLSDAQWLEDIQTLDTQLREKHANIFKYISESEWNKNIENLKSEVDSLSDTDIILRISQIVNTIGDGHTYIFPTDLLKPINKENLNPEIIVEFPIKGDYFKDGFRIVECESKYKKILGSKLIAINDIDINIILNDISTLMPGDYNNNQGPLAHAKSFINSYDILKFFNLVDSTSAKFTFENNHGNEIVLNLKAVENKKINYIQQSKKEMKTNKIEGVKNPYYWYENFQEDDILYFKYNAFSSNFSIYKDKIQSELFPDFKDVKESLLYETDKKQYDKFVIDLRQNFGGNVNIQNSMFSTIKFQQSLKNKDIYVITGKESFSASVIFAWELQTKLGATVVGETTGGNVNLFSTVNQTIELPNSNLKVIHSFKESIYDKNHNGGVVPDFEVIQTYEDYVNGIDTCYEFIKNLKN